MNPKLLNKQQTRLRNLLSDSDKFKEAMQMFLKHHAMLHSAKISDEKLWSFEDEILDDMSEEQVRRIPQNCEHSVAWCIWHNGRIEDITMNILVADGTQVLFQDEWLNRMKITARHSGNAVDQEENIDLSNRIDIQALRAYRLAVGRQTQKIAKQITADELKNKVVPQRLQRVMDEGAIVEAANDIIDYWGKRNIAGLLLMPATRHNIVHLNEALRIKKRRK